jgi:hypothetical protein
MSRTVIFDCRISEAGLWIRQDEIQGSEEEPQPAVRRFALGNLYLHRKRLALSRA